MNITNEGPADFIYHLVYKTTNTINGFIYIGIHSTKKLEDGYLGSGFELNRDIEYFGKENFKREILFQLDSREAILLKEAELVNKEFLQRNDVYNRSLGGQGKGKFCTMGKTLVRNKVTGEIKLLSTKDQRVLSEEFVSTNKGKFTAKNSEGKTRYLDKSDARMISGEFLNIAAGKIGCSKKLEDGTIITKQLLLDDPLYTSGEWKPMWCFLKHRQETKDKIGRANSISKLGEKNQYFGMMWIKNPITKESNRIKKEDPIPEGWVKGRYSPRKRAL